MPARPEGRLHPEEAGELHRILLRALAERREDALEPHAGQLRDALDQLRGLLVPDPDAPEPRVDLDEDGRLRADPLRRVAEPLGGVPRVHGLDDPAPRHGVVLRVGEERPHVEHADGDAGVDDLLRFPQPHGEDPPDPALSQVGDDGKEPVPVRVVLDARHHVRAGREALSQPVEVPPDGVEIDLEPCAVARHSRSDLGGGRLRDEDGAGRRRGHGVRVEILHGDSGGRQGGGGRERSLAREKRHRPDRSYAACRRLSPVAAAGRTSACRAGRARTGGSGRCGPPRVASAGGANPNRERSPSIMAKPKPIPDGHRTVTPYHHRSRARRRRSTSTSGRSAPTKGCA